MLVWLPAARTYAADSAPTAAPRPLTEESAQAFLDEFFASEQTQPFYKGAAVVVVKDGRVIAQQGYGYANVEAQEKTDPADTVFRVASVSKTFVAVAVMQLAEQGKIDLQTDIRQYLPGLAFENPFETPVTVEHLLTHRSGMEVRDPRSSDLHPDFSAKISIEDYARQHMPPVVREPGTAYMYDNFAYLLLGLIVQNVSGQPFEEYMEEHVFQPLGMTNSSFELTESLIKRTAVGYDPANQPIEPYALSPTIMPQGGMLSTAEDMSKFMLAFLNGGTYGSSQILTEKSVRAMSEYRSSIHPLLPDTTYGFEAPFQQPAAGSSTGVLTKLGDLPGNSSLLMFIPEQDVGVFLSYNQNGVLRDLFYAQFMSAFFPEYVAPAQLEPYEPSGPEKLKSLEGVYSDLRLSSVVTSVQVNPEGGLTLSDAFLGPRSLRQVDDNLFVDELTMKFTAFKMDEASGRAYMKEPYLNPLGYARQGVKPEGFADVDAAHPYAPFILTLQSLGLYPNDAAAAFKPEETVTRAELVRDLLRNSGLKPSDSAEYAFTDIEGHALAPYIQAAHELGMISGDGKGKFEPDRAATRQEAAVMVWSLSRVVYPDALFANTPLAGDTDAWAVPAVKMMVALGLHGPEVAVSEDGAADYRSKEKLTREEAAALFYQLLLQPVDQIVAQLSAPQQTEAATP